MLFSSLSTASPMGKAESRTPPSVMSLFLAQEGLAVCEVFHTAKLNLVKVGHDLQGIAVDNTNPAAGRIDNARTPPKRQRF